MAGLHRAPTGWTHRTVVAATGGCALFGAAFVTQLYRRHALAGAPPRRGGWLYPDTGPTWLHLLVNHISVSWTSRACDTLGPLALMLLAGWLSRRRRRPSPVVCAAAALAAVAVAVVIGKGSLGRVLDQPALAWNPMAISGPATATVVVLGLAAWLCGGELAAATGQALWVLAAAASLVVAVAQLYLGHRIDAVAVSLATGAAILAVALGCFGRAGLAGAIDRRWQVLRAP